MLDERFVKDIHRSAKVWLGLEEEIGPAGVTWDMYVGCDIPGFNMQVLYYQKYVKDTDDTQVAKDV